jgi:hypothetical protein
MTHPLCVVRLALDTSPRTWRALDPVALSRVPVQGECVRLADGRSVIVLGVEHLPGGDVAAELQCECIALAELPAATTEGAGQLDLESPTP